MASDALGPLALQNQFPTWNLRVQVSMVPIDQPMDFFGLAVKPLMSMYVVTATNGTHHIALATDRWSKEAADSLVELLTACEKSS